MVDGSGEFVSEDTVISESEAIAGFIKAKANGAKRTGLETVPTTTWLWHELRALGLPVIVRHGRYITFQLAEVAIRRSLFANILRLIDGLRPAPLSS